MIKSNTQFLEETKKEINDKESNICVGLDSDIEALPPVVRKNSSIKDSLIIFNKKIIDATHKITVSYKLNLAFYYSLGIEGIEAMKVTNQYIKSKYPSIKIIADSKRSEMKRSAELTAKELFDEYNFDAFTQTPWFGFDTLEPFLKYKNKAVFVICHDSNPSAGDIQDLKLNSGKYLYEYVTELVSKWNSSGNILIEAPLTYPKILKKIVEKAAKDQFFLLAGLGAQGGKIEDLKIFKKDNFLVSASRSIIFASKDKDFDIKAFEAAENFRTHVNSLNLK